VFLFTIGNFLEALHLIRVFLLLILFRFFTKLHPSIIVYFSTWCNKLERYRTFCAKISNLLI